MKPPVQEAAAISSQCVPPPALRMGRPHSHPYHHSALLKKQKSHPSRGLPQYPLWLKEGWDLGWAGRKLVQKVMGRWFCF